MMRRHWPDPLTFWALHMQTLQMLSEAGAVMWMRGLGMMGAWNTTAAENARMVKEKPDTFTRAGLDAFRAFALGEPLAVGVGAALRPIRRKTRANARRLAKRGPVTRRPTRR